MEGSRYIVVEGPIGAGKAALAKKLAKNIEARVVLEEIEANPFLPAFMRDRRRRAFQVQLYFLLSRFRQQQELIQLNLFHKNTVGDYLFERDRLFALVNLNEDELALYDQVFNLLRGRVPQPDLVIYLSARSEVLWQRLKAQPRYKETENWFSLDYLKKVNEAYNNFFYHYDRAPLLVVNTSDVDLISDEETYQHFLREVEGHQRGVKHYIPSGTIGRG
ncbi:MAG: deoxynucleoside kinase [Pseudomonadota bacterium]